MKSAIGSKIHGLRRWISVREWFQRIGVISIQIARDIGGISILFIETVKVLCGSRLRWKSTFAQMNFIGVMSLPLVFLTALFTGMVLSLQSAYQLQLFAAEQYTSDLVALSMTRELGPVLTAMMVAGRVGASMAAEIGTMKVTEQIDALKSLATDPVHYLVVPRFVATISMLVLLTIYSDVVGIFGGYVVG